MPNVAVAWGGAHGYRNLMNSKDRKINYTSVDLKY